MKRRLSERLAEALVASASMEEPVVVMTVGAVDELIALIEAAEALVEVANEMNPHRFLFDQEYHRQLNDALLRFSQVVHQTDASMSELIWKLEW